MINPTKIFQALFKPLLQVSDTRKDLDQKAEQIGLNELLTYMMMYNDKAILMKDGAFAATFAYRGPDVESSTDAELNQIVATVNHALKMTDSGWMVEFNLVRLHSTEYSSGQAFPDTVSKLIEDERRTQYQTEGAHFDTLTYITFTYLPERALKSSIKRFFLDSDQPIKETTIDDLYQRFEERLSNIIDVLTKYFKMDRLTGEELLTYLHYCMTGQKQKVQLPPVAMFVDSYLCHDNFVGGIRPRIGNKHIRVINISEYPAEDHVFPCRKVVPNSDQQQRSRA